MDLKTTYLGLELDNPLVAAASPLSTDTDSVKKLEDNGISAVVMHSLFEEQINSEMHELDYFLSQGSESFAEATEYFPQGESFVNLEAEDYLEEIVKLKKCVDIPVIASLNGVSEGGWMKYARHCEEAGADAIELNIFYIPTDPSLSADVLEKMYLDDLASVKGAVGIPVSVKLNPFFSSLPNLAGRLGDAGAAGLVLFNRFFEPDIDIETLELRHRLEPTRSRDLGLSLRWLAVLYGNVPCNLAASCGIHTYRDVLRAVMAGADVTMIASALLEYGPEYAAHLLKDMREWMEEKEYRSLEQMKGSMSYKAVANPSLYERANYVKLLQERKVDWQK